MHFGESQKNVQTSKKSYKNVLVHISDKLTVAKLHFFVYVAGILEPYLTCYQGDGPMLPFMCHDITKFYKALLNIVVKPKVLQKCKTSFDLISVELGSDTLIEDEKIHLGFAAEEEIRKRGAEVDQKSILALRSAAKNLVIAVCEKLDEKNPLSYIIVRNAICFKPKSIVEKKQGNLGERFKKLMKKLVSLKVMESAKADCALAQYKDFLAMECIQHAIFRQTV